ncbi:hypothetical protein APHMUC_0950 [Anaplasma phagocytophilum str. ApMUC09]|uniref:Uncharacterized protein n=1 Tax=Anaplasma phagocytophilum str. ApMUC09 TaxID=1359152 RepID=A0A0F3N7S6_ANAPH|nr:hypothetical protein APHMUC_0950 [Anaplasma phagocytophilum str. ApMUC09]
MAVDSIVIDNDLKSSINKRAFSKSYYRAGILCAALCGAVAIFSLSYAVATGLVISLHTTMFAVAMAASVMFLLSVLYSAVVAALEHNSAKIRIADGTVSRNSSPSKVNFYLNVIKRWGSSGYTSYQTTLVYLMISSLWVASGFLGAIIGQGGTIGQLLTIPATGVMVAVFQASLIIFLASSALLFLARLFAEEYKVENRVFIFPDCKLPCRMQPEQFVEVSGATKVAAGVTHADFSGPTEPRPASDAVYYACVQEGVEVIESVLNDSIAGNVTEITTVKCVVSSPEPGIIMR